MLCLAEKRNMSRTVVSGEGKVARLEGGHLTVWGGPTGSSLLHQYRYTLVTWH